MKWAGNSRGYTIVETMIFLAVSGALFLIASTLISGQQAKTEFNAAIHDTESSIQDIINQVYSGYYPNNGKFNCNYGGSGPQFDTTSGTYRGQGENDGCVFAGKAIQFSPQGSNKLKYTVYPVAANRLNTVGKNVVSRAEAKPVIMSPGSISHTDPPHAEQTINIGGGVTAEWVRYKGIDVGSFAFMNSFSADAIKRDGTYQIDLIAIHGTAISNPQPNTVDLMNSYLRAPSQPDSINPDTGVIVCLQSNGTNQHALLTIGGGGSRIGTKLDIVSGSC